MKTLATVFMVFGVVAVSIGVVYGDWCMASYGAALVAASWGTHKLDEEEN